MLFRDALIRLINKLRRSRRYKLFEERLLPKANFMIATRDPRRPPLSNREITQILHLNEVPSGVVDLRASHNIVVNMGRQWLRNLVCSSEFPSPLAADIDLGTDYSIVPTPASLPGDKRTYRIRYMAVGLGGALQNVDPPGQGSYVEQVSVQGLERPNTVLNLPPNQEWMKEVLPVDNLADPLLLPDEYTVRFRGIFAEGDVSYTGSEDYLGTVWDTDVPISEAGLFTSQADPFTAPYGGLATPAYGLVAYNTFRTLNKTSGVVLELAWELRF